MADGQDQQRRAGGYFLVGLGAPIAAAFVYPFISGRRGGPLIEWQALSAQELAVFAIGAGAGIAMTVAGTIILKWR